MPFGCVRALSVECHHRVVSADETDSHVPAAQYVAHLLVRSSPQPPFHTLFPIMKGNWRARADTLGTDNVRKAGLPPKRHSARIQ